MKPTNPSIPPAMPTDFRQLLQGGGGIFPPSSTYDPRFTSRGPFSDMAWQMAGNPFYRNANANQGAAPPPGPNPGVPQVPGFGGGSIQDVLRRFLQGRR